MSYDLFLKPRNGDIEADRFIEYFRKRRHYQVEGMQAWYQHSDTGVYFAFELRSAAETADEDFFPVTFNMNYFRPSFFGLEAEPEVRAFVGAFDMTVSDPQTGGMGDGEYSSELFLNGWNQGNEFGYAAILRDPANRKDLVTLPAADLRAAWSWNLSRADLQEEVGGSKFVPSVLIVLIDGKPATAAVWPDGLPIAVPPVDYFIVPRRELAPRKLFRRAEDQALVTQHEALPLLQKFSKSRPDGTLVLDYDDAPPEIRAYVQGLAPDERDISGVATDQALDREIAEKHCV